MTLTTFGKPTPKLSSANDRWIVEVPVEQAEDVLEPSVRTFGEALVDRVQRYFFHREIEARRFLGLFQRPSRRMLAI